MLSSLSSWMASLRLGFAIKGMITPTSPSLPLSLSLSFHSFLDSLSVSLFLFVQYPSHTTPNMQGGALLSVHLGPSRATLNTLSLSPPLSSFFSPLRGAHCLQWRKGSIVSCPSSSSSLHLSPPYRAGSLFMGRSNLMSGRPREILPSFALAEDSVSPVALLESNGTAFGKTLQLGALFGTWYLFNIYFNIYNKQVLRVFPFPITLSLAHLAVGSIMVIFMWITGICKRPHISKSQLLSIMPLACLHAFGTIFTNMSLGKVSVSFTHTIKATEPFFTVILSLLFLGEYPGTGVVLSLLPIVGGVVLASFTEASFNWAGFLSAMASNLANQSRNVVSKQLMLEKEDPIDDINLFSIITIMSFLCLAPLALLFEGLKFTPSYLQLAALDVKVTVTRTILAAVCFHLYQQVAYMILQRVSPVTHSVGNCVKRVVVIVAAVLFFRTPVSIMNAFGTAIALVGVFAYSKATQRKSQVLTRKGD